MNSLAFSICWCVLQVTAVSLLSAGAYLLLKRFAPRTRGLVPLTSLASVVLLTALLLSPWPRWSGTHYLSSQLSAIGSQLSAFSVQQEESLPTVVRFDSVGSQHLVIDAGAIEGRPEVAAAGGTVTTHNQNDLESAERSLAANDPAETSNSQSKEKLTSTMGSIAAVESPAIEDFPVAVEDSSRPSAPRGNEDGVVMSRDAEHSDFNDQGTSVGGLMFPVHRMDESQATVHWPLFVLALFVVSLTVGFVRLLIGLAFVRTQRRGAQPIEEPALLDLVGILCDQAGGTRWVDVRESPQLSTAATIGWRRPVILLPSDWRNWSDDERRAVLAHEIAHIKHRDFPAWLAAQFGLSLHFYHPLVHWLVSRLRLEQELAADALAAPLAGGRALYLNTLAAMTLRQADRPADWPARPFLPTRGTLLRRIEMLKNTSELPSIVSRPVRIAVIAVVFCAGVAAAGLRPGSDELGTIDTAPVVSGSSDLNTAAFPKPTAPPSDRRQVVGLEGTASDASEAAFVENDALASGGRQSPVEGAKGAFAEGPTVRKADDAGGKEASAASQSERAESARHRAEKYLSRFYAGSKSQAPNDPQFPEFKPSTPDDEQYVKQTRENFEKIAAALRKYRAVHGQLPPPVVSRGRQTHSWRVAILPFFEGTDGLELYEQYKFDEQWDGPNNKKLLDKMPAVYRSPLDQSGSNTASYFAVTGPLLESRQESSGLMFGRRRTEDDDDQERRIAELAAPSEFKKNRGKDDRSSATIPKLIILEAKRSTPWTKPNEIYFDPEGPIEQLNGYHEQVLPMLTGEGTIRFLPRSLDRAQIIGALAGAKVETASATADRPAPSTSETKSNSTSAKPATGTFQGRVVFEGTPPVLQPLFKAGDTTVRDSAVVAAQDMPDERLVVGKDKGVANVFVYINKLPEGISIHPPLVGELRLSFQSKLGRFMPHALIMRPAASVIVLSNDEPIAMNVHTYPRRNMERNQMLAARDHSGVELVYTRSESEPIEVKSDLHPWMHAYHLPLDHPFAAVTNADGKFTIEGLPPGSYKFQVWHEACDGRFLAKDLAVEIKAGETTQLAIKYPAEKLVIANTEPGRTGKIMFGRGAKSDAGVVGEIVLDADKVLAQAKPAADEETPEQHRSRVNLKRLLLAMHNYHDVHNHFPPAVAIGPDGKTPHSWRVELLPYIERMDGNKLGAGTYKDIYDAYKFDEPWDGPNNKKLIEKMPDVFRAPGDEPKSTTTSYFAVTSRYWEDLIRDRDKEGKPNTAATLFDGLAGRHMKDISDGTSYTIMLVESKLIREVPVSVPWTKPDDVVYEAEKPVPAIGGIHKEGYFAGFADGSPHWIPSGIDEKTQRGLFTRAGGEGVKRPE